MKKVLLVILILAIAGAAFWYWQRPAAGGEGEGEIKPVAQVQTTVLKKQSISRNLTAYGVVEASAVGAQAVTLAYDAIIREVVAPVGTRVAAGEVILKVEPTPDALLQWQSAKGLAALAEKSLASVKQRYELKLATGDDLRVAEQAALDAHLKTESYAKRGMDQGSSIKAPAAAILIKLDAQPGMVVPAGTALVTLGQSAHLQVRLSIEAADLKLVQLGQVVSLSPINRPEADPVAGAIGVIGAMADASTGTVDVRVPLPSESDWIAGEHVEGLIQIEEKTALAVPRSAVLPDDEDEVLYTIKDHKAVRHTVKLGIESSDLVEVSSLDLHPGDLVVTEGNAELSDGMGVQLPGEKPKDEDDKGKTGAEAAKEPADAKEAKPAPSPESKDAEKPKAGAKS